jgi:hypothetical protein
MKKKILGGIAVLAIAAIAAMNVNLNTTSGNLSDTSLANVEVLAYGENIDGKAYVHCSGTDVICVGSGYFTCCR